MFIYKHGEATYNFIQTRNLSIMNCLIELLSLVWNWYIYFGIFFIKT